MPETYGEAIEREGREGMEVLRGLIKTKEERRAFNNVVGLIHHLSILASMLEEEEDE